MARHLCRLDRELGRQTSREAERAHVEVTRALAIGYEEERTRVPGAHG
jgi:hypothetical protein